MMRRSAIVFVCVVVASLALPLSAVGDMQLPTYQIGDQWVYSVNLNFEGMAVISGDWTFEVVDEITVSGHEAYDISIEGTGTASMFGLGAGSYDMEGLSYIRKSDLAAIREDIMIDINVTIFSEVIRILAYMNTTHDPPMNQFDFPVKEGDIWSSISTTTFGMAILSDNPLIPGSVSSSTETETTDFECESKETVEVPAGKFKSYRIKTTEASGNTTYNYISTESGYLVKTQICDESGASVGNLNLKSFTYTPPGTGNGDDLISDLMEYLWLLIMLIVVIIVVILVAVLSRRSKEREPPLDESPLLDEENK
ncbi:MAG: hypothetical protein KAW09_07010 [Thermoplasmata archaeon]|nr:hypothetical protein [Thermoplasmata archaeon]